MLLRKSLSFIVKRINLRKNIHIDAKEERTKALRNVSKSLFNHGKLRFEADKTSTNVYEHFEDPTLNKNDIKASERLRDFEVIHSVTVNFGSPEMSDQMSGSIYMHANMEEDKCSQVKFDMELFPYSLV